MGKEIPAWAVQCLDIWPKVNKRFIDRWDELDQYVWPALQQAGFTQSADELTNGPDHYFNCLDVAAWSAQYGKPQQAKVVSAEQKELRKLNQKIRAKADQLASSLKRRNEILECGIVGISGDELDIWQLLKRAADNFPDWASIAESNMRLFTVIDLANGQTRDGPELVDLIVEIAEAELPPDELRSSWQPVGDSRKITAAHLRIFTGRLDERAVLEHLTDAAVASLAAVAFDKPADHFNPAQLGMLKSRTRKKLHLQ